MGNHDFEGIDANMTRCHHKFCLPHDKDPKLHTHMPPSWLVKMNCRVIEVMERINNDCHLGELVVGAGFRGRKLVSM